MSLSALVARAQVEHIPGMTQGAGWRSIGKGQPGTTVVVRALICAIVLLGFGCGSDDGPYDPNGYYELGGQTGSLVPGCGIAPLSAAGLGVPASDALAVLYTKDCLDPEALALIALEGTGPVDPGVVLVPLDDDGTYLVQASYGLPAGDYQLSYGESAGSDLRLEAVAPDVPESLGPLRLVPGDGACPERLRFELELDAAALAYAPLSRFMLRIDDGLDQLWVDYGALVIESDAEGSRGVLELPSCGVNACLTYGSHSLLLSLQIAGEGSAPEPLEIDFEIECPTAPVADSSAESYGPSCALGGAPRRPARGTAGAAAACLVWLALRLSRRSCRAR